MKISGHIRRDASLRSASFEANPEQSRRRQNNLADSSKRGSAFFIFNPKAQSTLEYIIVWTAIVVAILVASTKYLGEEGGAIDTAISKVSDKIKSEVGRLTD